MQGWVRRPKRGGGTSKTYRNIRGAKRLQPYVRQSPLKNPRAKTGEGVWEEKNVYFGDNAGRGVGGGRKKVRFGNLDQKGRVRGVVTVNWGGG